MFEIRDLLIPVNRRLLVEIHNPPDTKMKSAVLLPEEFKKHTEKYARVTIMAAASSCHESYLDHLGRDAIIEKSMIEDFQVGPHSVNMILENYVLALIKEKNES
jgi:hypothetical protein